MTWSDISFKKNQKNSKDVQEFLDRGGVIQRMPDYVTRAYYNDLRMLGIIQKEILKHGKERERKILGVNEEPYEEEE